MQGFTHKVNTNLRVLVDPDKLDPDDELFPPHSGFTGATSNSPDPEKCRKACGNLDLHNHTFNKKKFPETKDILMNNKYEVLQWYEILCTNG